jgi:hypothetical protein
MSKRVFQGPALCVNFRLISQVATDMKAYTPTAAADAEE